MCATMPLRGLILPILTAIAVGCNISAAQDIAADAPTGSFGLSATTTDILGPDRAADFASVIAVDEAIEWEIVVPDNYDPQKPPWLLVYVSPSDSGRLPRGWLKLLKSHSLIWVAGNASGNRVPVARRITFAVLGSALVAERYELDERRVYLAGFSGGARVSGLAAAAYPTLFRGAIYIGGAELWGQQSRPDDLERMRQNRFVFLVGSEDANRAVARAVHSKYAQAGIGDLKMIVVRRMGHVLPESRFMSGALDFLDGKSD